MPNHYHLIVFIMVLASSIAASARAQNATEQREQQEEQQIIEGKNPLLPKRTQVAFSGTGSAKFNPRSLAASVPGATPDPSCTPTVTQVGFSVQCLSDPDSKSSTTCRGSMSLFGFNETRAVVGQVTAMPGDVYSMKLNSSSDDDLQGCELVNVAPVSSSLGNVISMPGCGVNIAGCAGEAIGAGANSALTSSGSVILTPSD